MTPNIMRRLTDSRILILGQLVGQGALVVVVPLLTRSLTPSALGVYQVAMAVALIIQPLATLRLEFVIPSTRNYHLVQRRVAIGYGVSAGFSITLAVAALAFGTWLHLADPGILYGAALILLAYGWMAVDNSLLIRQGELRRLGIRNALAGLIAAAFQVVAALAWPSALALAVGLVAGRLIAIAVTRVRMGLSAPTDLEDDQDEKFTAARSIKAISSGVISNASVQSLLVTTSLTFGASAAGQVGIAQRIAGAPTTLVGQALGQLMTARAAPFIRDRASGLTRSMWGITGKLLLLSLAATVLLALGGPLLAVPVLGPGWGVAGTVLAVLAAPLCLQFAVLPMMSVFVMLKREGAMLILQAVRFVFVTGTALVVALVSQDLIWTCVAVAVVWVTAYGANVVVFFRLTRIHDQENA